MREFLQLNRQAYERTLSGVRDIVMRSLRQLPIYKIYGRDEKQGGAVLKEARKVRLKFDAYFRHRGEVVGSLWSVPDIVGFTIVVAYPSDINDVSAAIDDLIDAKRLVSVSSNSTTAIPGVDGTAKTIRTRHGRALTDKGYFACHYNLRLTGPGKQSAKPICEVQIKTVMHDAWGAKSHDLTYKPSGKTAQELIDSFNLLGDTLAVIDRQSDLIRHSIARGARVREQKLHFLQVAILTDAVGRSVLPSTDPNFALLQQVAGYSPEIFPERLDELFDQITAIYAVDPRACSTAMCLLALKSGKSQVRETALETFDAWLAESDTPRDRFRAHLAQGLAAYCFNDVDTAIEATEGALETLLEAKGDEDWATPTLRVNLYANLAYYHAARVGSHAGELGNSAQKASDAIAIVDALISAGTFPGIALDAEYDTIAEAIRGADGRLAFSILDTSAFVRIQTTDSIDELQRTISKLRDIYRLIERENLAADWHVCQATRALMIDFNDYCARIRLTELETRA